MQSDSDPGMSLALARASIAAELLEDDQAPETLGEITLYPHQRHAVARLQQLLRLTGGAMLADTTGLGKTFVALAIATRFIRPLVVAPAALIDGWRAAASRAHASVHLLSMDRLSRGAPSPIADPDLVVFDEAHHLRNARTKRYAAAAALCDRSAVLLLSATPLQNRREDLLAQLALFLGETVAASTDADLARLIVRRRADDLGLRLPVVHGPRRVDLAVDDDLLDELLAIPPPLPGRDEGEAGALVTYTLLRQWASSRAALVGALRRRLAKSLALAAALEAGRWPTRDELLTWCHADDTLQLAFPELFDPLGTTTTPRHGALLEAVRCHGDAVRSLLARVRGTDDPDRARASAIDEICRAHPKARIIAFSQYAETVRALSRLLMHRRPGVAALTARAGSVAGGRIARRDVLAQFAPRTTLPDPPEAERVSLLVTTDVLSEGLDLQRASVVVHLDLPWNPARLEQRVGRVCRLGSPHDHVFVYAIAPPASSERVLQVETRLRAKLQLATSTIGLTMPALADAMPHTGHDAPPELASSVRVMIEGWRNASFERKLVPGTPPLVAGVASPNEGFLALVALGSERRLVAAIDGCEPSTDPTLIARVTTLAAGMVAIPGESECRGALEQLRRWCERWAARQRLTTVTPAGSRVRVRIAERITELLAAAPRHERVTVSALASQARRTLAVPLGAGAERRLSAFADDASCDASWLTEIAALAGGRRTTGGGTILPAPVVIIILCRKEPPA